MKTTNRNQSLEVDIVDGELRIHIGVDTLAFAAENPPGNGLWGDGAQVKVLNNDQWAEDVRDELKHEEEDGTTVVHLLFDAAMRQACENGSATKKKRRKGWRRKG